MGKQYCKMTLKELLEYLSSEQNDAEAKTEPKPGEEKKPEESKTVSGKRIVTIDVQTQKTAVDTKGVGVIYLN